MKISYSLPRYLLLNFTIFNGLLLWFNYSPLAIAQTVINKKCSNNLEDLANSLVKDIPDYSNRVIQRNRTYSHPLQFFPFYVITAGNLDLKPLPLNQNQYQDLTKSNLDNNVEQIFFTTLEKQYSTNNRIIETQNFHWLMLTNTPQHWKLVMAFTILGYPDNFSSQNFISSPVIDSTEGIIGQAVTLWLRDCNENF